MRNEKGVRRWGRSVSRRVNKKTSKQEGHSLSHFSFLISHFSFLISHLSFLHKLTFIFFHLLCKTLPLSIAPKLRFLGARIANRGCEDWYLSIRENLLNLDFAEKCVNFVVRILSGLSRPLFLFVTPWKSSMPSFYVGETSFEERKTTLKEGFPENIAQNF